MGFNSVICQERTIFLERIILWLYLSKYLLNFFSVKCSIMRRFVGLIIKYSLKHSWKLAMWLIVFKCLIYCWHSKPSSIFFLATKNVINYIIIPNIFLFYYFKFITKHLATNSRELCKIRTMICQLKTSEKVIMNWLIWLHVVSNMAQKILNIFNKGLID